MKKVLIPLIILVLIVAGGLVYWFVFYKDLSGRIVIPYIAHQKPRIDPHVPSTVPIADKLDEALFDGLFNVSANPSGVVYEDGLGEFVEIDRNGVVSIRLKPARKWHSSFSVTMEKEKIAVGFKQGVLTTAQDIRFTLNRIQRLGSLSPDYILVSQAVADFDFTGPDENDIIKLQFRGDRIWTENDIKEVLSFKVIPDGSPIDAPSYTNGSGPYLLAGEYEDAVFFHKILEGKAFIPQVILKPFIDNSTYSTEIKNKNINALLSTPFGAISPILQDTSDLFYKSSIATVFFALFYNTERLNLQQRIALRALIDNKRVLDRFFKVGTQQQRHIANYRGAGDNYDEYLNSSIFPATSYYVEEEIVMPLADRGTADVSTLPDTVRIQTCLNYDYRVELGELVDIFNDPSLFGGKVKASAVSNDEIRAGGYDAVLIPITGYRSNFLFDLYNIFLREPDFGSYRISLQTAVDKKGKEVIEPRSLTAAKNFFRLDAERADPEQADVRQLLDYVFGFMATREIGDKQAYARFIDEIDQRLALGSWLFSLPSLAYFRTQFDAPTIDIYGTASQLSTIEKWQERAKK